MDRVTIVGGGLAGLIAAISVAEDGVPVTLHEARGALGGRALTHGGPYKANLGPHALYHGGSLDAWLRQRDLLPEGRPPAASGFRLMWRGRMRRIPPWSVLRAIASAGRAAPVDADYRSFARDALGEVGAEAAVGLASLPTFHADPGALSAAFVQYRMKRSYRGAPAVSYVLGGWARLVASLEARARSLGVAIETGSKLSSLPPAVSIVATDLPAAARLLGDGSLVWPGPRTAMLDIAVRRARGDVSNLLDLERRVYVSRYSAYDDGLAPAGEQLIQACAGVGEEEGVEPGVVRIESALDEGFPDWRSRTTWRRQGLSDGGAGAADPPGHDWRDRPAVERGDDVFLCGDRVAAPGLLSEVACASACEAARRAVAAVRGGRGVRALRSA